MLTKTRGIVLHSLKYSDNTNIVTIFTSEFGKISFMVHGANKKKSKLRAALLQPLTIIEADMNYHPEKDIQSIKDARIATILNGIMTHPVKNTLAIFISEVLYRTMKQTDPDEHLYDFLEKSVKILDVCEEGIANFHIVFLIKLSKFFGFAPNNDEKSGKYFDLLNGVFVHSSINHKELMGSESSFYLSEFLKVDYLSMRHLKLSREQRFNLLEDLITYYKLHVAGFHGLNSLNILHTLFD